MPDRVLFKAYQSKQADRDCIAHCVALTLAEIKLTERRKDYLSAIYGQLLRVHRSTLHRLDFTTGKRRNRGDDS